MDMRRPFRFVCFAFFCVASLGRTATALAGGSAKLGIGRVFPMSYRDSNGKLRGFAIDVLNEAARREKVALEWTAIKSSTDSEDDLRSGAIDLLPAGMVTPERQRLFYVSEPWWSTETTLVSRVDHETLNRIAINPIYAALARQAFPKALLAPYPWVDWAVKAACKGEVDGALIAHGELHDVLLNPPEECSGVRLASGDTTTSIQLAIIARKNEAELASRLRRRIDEMAADGTLMRMAVQNPPIPIGAVAQYEQRLKARMERRVWIIGSGMCAAFLAYLLLNRQRNLIQSRRSEAKLRKLHEELNHANRTMKLSLEAGNSGAWTWSLDSGELFWTEAYCRLLRVDPAVKPTPELFYSVVHPDDVKRVKADLDACLQGTKRECRIEFRIRRPDGIRWIERRGRIYEDRNGKPVELVGISTDITERKILRGLLSTCAQCKKVKDEHDHWHMMERYISDHSEARFSHGLCPDCASAWEEQEGLKGEHIAGSVGR